MHLRIISMRQQCPLLAQSGHSLRCNAMSAFGSKADIVRGSATGDFARPKISKIFCEASPHAARATVFGGWGTQTRPREILARARVRQSAYVFVNERGQPFGRMGIGRMIERAGEAAKLPFPVHVHMLRHSTGYALANKGMDTRRLQHFLAMPRSPTRCAIRRCRRSPSRTFGDNLEGP
jgi:hypothetical protein